MRISLTLRIGFVTLLAASLLGDADEAASNDAEEEAEIIQRLEAEMAAVAEGLGKATEAWQAGDLPKAWEIVSILSLQYPENHRVKTVLEEMRATLTQAIEEAREADLARYRVNQSADLNPVDRIKYRLAVARIDETLINRDVGDIADLREAFSVIDQLLDLYPHMLDGQLFSAQLALVLDDPVRARSASTVLLRLGFREWHKRDPALTQLYNAYVERGWISPSAAGASSRTDETLSDDPILNRIREALNQ